MTRALRAIGTGTDPDATVGEPGVLDSRPVPEVLTVPEAAVYLRIGRDQLYNLVGRGEIPHRRIGRTIRLHKSAIDHWLGVPSPACSLSRQESE